MIRIVIIEDSEVVGLLLEAIIAGEPDMRVVGRALDGRAGVELVERLRPDLVTMDIRMPVMDGFQATRQIMSRHPTPIVVVSSSVDDEELQITFRAIEEGALAVIEKPRGVTHPDFAAIRASLVTTLRAMAEVRLVRRFLHRTPLPPPPAAPPRPTPPRHVGILGLGCSTGGPQTLQAILEALPPHLPFPVVVVQHIAVGFIGGLASWLDSKSPLAVGLARDGEALRAGCVYLAPDHKHLTVHHWAGEFHARLTNGDPVNGFRPSATPLFTSLATAAPGGRGAGGVLTGMGNDGAEGLLAMRLAGCHTFVQDKKSAIVYGMPAKALALSAVEEVVPLERMAFHITQLAERGR